MSCPSKCETGFMLLVPELDTWHVDYGFVDGH
jgi:hypothetical protein